jgi:Ig-like domain from next to BRCA1 gene
MASPTSPVRRSLLDRVPGPVWALLGVTGALLLAHNPILLSGFARTQNDLGDTRFNHYILEHGLRWLLQRPGHESFWDPPFFFPAYNVAAYSDVLATALPLYALWRALGFLPDTSFQLWLLSLTALNFAAAWALLRRGLAFSAWASAFGALLFAAAGMRTNQTMHPQLFPQAFTAVAALALVRIARPVHPPARSRRVWLGVLFACLSAQLWAGFYLGWFLGIGLLLLLPVALLLPEGRRVLGEVLRAHPVLLAAGALLTLASLVPMALPYLEASRELGVRPYGEVRTMLPLPQAWFHLGRFSWLYATAAALPPFRVIPMEHEQRIGLGLLTTLLCAAGFWAMRRRPAGLLALGLTVAVVFLVTRWGAFEPWRVVYEAVPGAKAIRAVSRVALMLLLPLSVALAGSLEALGRRWGAWVALPLGLLAALEQGQTTPSFDKEENRRDVSAIAARVPRDCDAFLYAPVLSRGPWWKEQLDGMWAALESGVPTLNGYSGSEPRGWPFHFAAINTEADAERVARALEGWRAERRLGADWQVCLVRRTETDGPDGAEVEPLEVPRAVSPGEPVTARVRVRNTGSTPWEPEDEVGLLGHGSLVGAGRLLLLSRAVPPGETVELSVPLAAPDAPGLYPVSWRMFAAGRGAFGELSPQRMVWVHGP